MSHLAQEPGPTVVVHHQVHPGAVARAGALVGGVGHLAGRLHHVRGQARRGVEGRRPGGVAGAEVVVVVRTVGDDVDLDRREDLVVDDRDRELGADHLTLDQRHPVVAERPDQGVGQSLQGTDVAHAHAPPALRRLDHQR